MAPQERIQELARKYVNRNLSQEEAEELFTWLGQTKGPGQSDAVFKEEWLQGRRDHSVDTVTWDRIRQLSREKYHKKQTRTAILPVFKWVAAASLVLAVVFMWWLNTSPPEWVVYETGYGETLPIYLDEGSRVVLNANSRLTWNKDWQSGDQIRLANLEGEAFFEVTQIGKDDGQDGSKIPFRVQTADLVVHVLGTSFNVVSRRGQTDVFLEKGAITLDLLQMNQQNEVGVEKLEPYDPVVMNPGELVSFSAHSGKLQVGKKSESAGFTDWKEGTLNFSREKFGDVLFTLEDIYGKKFEVSDGDLLDRTVNLVLPYKDWETVRQLIGIPLSVEFVEQGEDIIRIEKREGK